MPWLVRGIHIGYLCSLIERCRLVERGWSAAQIVDQIDRVNRAELVTVTDPGDQRDPLGYFAWHLRRAIPDDAIAPFVQLAAERSARRASRAAAHAADVDRRAEIAAQHSEITEIIESMRRQFPRRGVIAK